MYKTQVEIMDRLFEKKQNRRLGCTALFWRMTLFKVIFDIVIGHHDIESVIVVIVVES